MAACRTPGWRHLTCPCCERSATADFKFYESYSSQIIELALCPPCHVHEFPNISVAAIWGRERSLRHQGPVWGRSRIAVAALSRDQRAGCSLSSWTGQCGRYAHCCSSTRTKRASLRFREVMNPFGTGGEVAGRRGDCPPGITVRKLVNALAWMVIGLLFLHAVLVSVEPSLCLIAC